ncbi:MAG: hypothetical protein HUK22_06775 [Thermoguttaceae bacterium]|nr:hypothetical protein [Thermoguttaceae bacterium]
MLGDLLKGGAWCGTIALATLGALTLAPDDAWRSFPNALAPVRAKLAQMGVAPSQYIEQNVQTVEQNVASETPQIARRDSGSVVKIGGRRAERADDLVSKAHNDDENTSETALAAAVDSTSASKITRQNGADVGDASQPIPDAEIGTAVATSGESLLDDFTTESTPPSADSDFRGFASGGEVADVPAGAPLADDAFEVGVTFSGFDAYGTRGTVWLHVRPDVAFGTAQDRVTRVLQGRPWLADAAGAQD